jgi:hypothetical protein
LNPFVNREKRGFGIIFGAHIQKNVKSIISIQNGVDLGSLEILMILLTSTSSVDSAFHTKFNIGFDIGRLFLLYFLKVSRGEWGYMKRQIVWGKVKHSCYFSAKTSLKFVSPKNKVRVSFCPCFIQPRSPLHIFTFIIYGILVEIILPIFNYFKEEIQ